LGDVTGRASSPGSEAWIQDQEVRIADDKIVEYRVHMKVTFILAD